MGQAKAGPVVTDNGNFVIDATFDEAHMREPESLLTKLKMLTGVVEVGLFCGMARAAYFGNQDGSVTVRWSDGQSEILKEGEEAKITRDMVDSSSRVPEEALLLVEGSSSSSAVANNNNNNDDDDNRNNNGQPDDARVSANTKEATPEALREKLENLTMHTGLLNSSGRVS